MNIECVYNMDEHVYSLWQKVFTCGKIPYGRAGNAEVVEFVQRGQRLERPRTCPREVYNVMKLCWEK